jgi:PST family polysaccharide transporter
MTANQEDHRPANAINRRLAFGALAMGVVSIFKVVLQLIALPVIARFLGPGEFGLYALAIPLISFVSTLADGGLGISLVREPEPSSLWSTAFWALLLIGFILAGLVTAWGFVLGAITHQPELPGIVAALSVTLIFLTSAVTPMARLDRQGRIAVGAGAELAGNIVGAALGIISAILGAGAWSLVAQYISIYLIRSLIVNFVAFKMPGKEFRLRDLKGHFAVGGVVLGTRVADYFGRMLETLGVGHLLGTAPLGLYTFSNQVSRFLSEAPGNPLWLTLYLRTLREDEATAQAFQLQASRILAVILLPGALLAVAAAPDLFHIFLGKKWIKAIPLFQILLPAYVAGVIGNQSGAVLLARGRYVIQLYGTIGLNIAKLSVVCLVPWIGLLGAARGVAIVMYVNAAIMLVVGSSITKVAPGTILRGLAGPLVSSLGAGMVCCVLLNHVHVKLFTLILILVLSAVFYVVCSFLLDRRRFVSDITMLRKMAFKSSAGI